MPPVLTPGRFGLGIWSLKLHFAPALVVENHGKALGSPCAVGYTHTLARVRVAKSVWQNQKIFLRVGNQLFRRNVLPGSTWLPGALPPEIASQE